jgi:hypothetical protein
MSAPDFAPATAPAAMAQPAAAGPASTTATTRALEEERAPDVATLTSSTRELSFGVEKPRSGNRGRWLAVAAAVIVAVVAAGNYAAWSWDVRDPATLVAQAPTGPNLSRGTPALALPVPPIEEIDQVFVIVPAARRAPVDVPQLVDTPPEANIPMAPNVVPTFPSF